MTLVKKTNKKPTKIERSEAKSAPLSLGILGGGQLARMLALEAAPLGLTVYILSLHSTDPAAQVVRNWVQGNPSDEKTIREFCKNLDFLTFESEFIDSKKIELATQDQSVKIFPNLKAMDLLQNRSSQKELLTGYDIPTASYINVRNLEDLKTAVSQFPKGFVLKKCKGGYDGYGTYYYRKPKDLERLKSLLPGEFIAEEFVKFKRELAISFARSEQGALISLPLVESYQVNSRCDWVLGPIKHAKVNSLSKKIKRFLDSIDYVGIIAFEIFDTGKDLLINEVAPRVHNSAHYSQQALSHSQFKLHILAGLNASMEYSLQAKSFCMINLIGSGKSEISLPTRLKGFLHWYGKDESRKGRKMGHLNFIGKDQGQLLKLAQKEREKFEI